MHYNAPTTAAAPNEALLEAAVAEKRDSRRRAAERLAEAGGDHVLAQRLEDDAAQGELRARVLAAVAREMGLAAPAEGSSAREALADRLFHAVGAYSLARVEIFSESVRAKLHQAYVERQRDSGAFDQEWQRAIVVDGRRGLADESDAQLLERILTSLSSAYLVDGDGVWLGEDESDFLNAMSSLEAVGAVHRAAPVLDSTSESGLTSEAADLREALSSLGQRFEAHGLRSPYESLLETLDGLACAEPGPRP